MNICFTCDKRDCPGICERIDGKTRKHRPPDRTLYECQGLEMTIGDWARAVGMHPSTLTYRIRVKGMDMETALTRKVANSTTDTQLYTVGNRAMSISDWARELGKSPALLYRCIANGLTMPEIVTGQRHINDSYYYRIGRYRKV